MKEPEIELYWKDPPLRVQELADQLTRHRAGRHPAWTDWWTEYDQLRTASNCFRRFHLTQWRGIGYTLSQFQMIDHRYQPPTGWPNWRDFMDEATWKLGSPPDHPGMVAYREALDRILCTQHPDVEGIPVYKLGAVQGWWITPTEIERALETYQASKHSLKMLTSTSKTWVSFLLFLRDAAFEGNGFRRW